MIVNSRFPAQGLPRKSEREWTERAAVTSKHSQGLWGLKGKLCSYKEWHRWHWLRKIWKGLNLNGTEVSLV